MFDLTGFRCDDFLHCKVLAEILFSPKVRKLKSYFVTVLPFCVSIFVLMKMIVAYLVFAMSLLTGGIAIAAETILLKRGLPTDLLLTWSQSDELTEQRFVHVLSEELGLLKGDELGNERAAGFNFVRLPIDGASFLAKRGKASREKLLHGVRKIGDDIMAADIETAVDLQSIPHSEINGLVTIPDALEAPDLHAKK